jgi:hypothetical protein
MKEHQHNIRLIQLDKSALAEHGFNHNHKILVQEFEVLFTKSGYLDRLIMEAIEVNLHPNNINREDGLILSRAWKPIIRLLQENSDSFSATQSHPVNTWYRFLEFGSPSSRHGHFSSLATAINLIYILPPLLTHCQNLSQHTTPPPSS